MKNREKLLCLLTVVAAIGPMCLGQNDNQESTASFPDAASDTNKPIQEPRGLCTKLDIVMILDYSGSISFVGGWGSMIHFAEAFVNQFIRSPDSHISILTFSRNSTLREDWLNIPIFATFINEQLFTIPTPPGGGTTVFEEAFLEAQRQLKKRELTGPSNKIILIVTDGIPVTDHDWEQAKYLSESLREDNIKILSVGVGPDKNKKFLKVMSKEERYITEVESFDDLVDRVEEIKNSTSCQYEGSQNQVQDLPEFDPNLLEICPNAKADVVFLLDGSESIDFPSTRGVNFFEMRDFTREILNNFNINPQGVQVGVFQFGIEVIEHFPLGGPGSLQDLDRLLVSQIPYTNQRATDIGVALNYTMRQAFNTRVDRPDATNIIVLLTDGKTFWDGGVALYSAQNIDNQGVEIIVVGFTDTPDLYNIKLLSSQPQRENFNWFRSGTDQIAYTGTANSIIRAMCPGANQPNFPSQGPLGGITCPKLDIVFVVDSSGSISFTGGEPAWNLMLDFVKAMIGQFKVGPDDTHVAVIQFSSDTSVVFNLNITNQNLERITQKIDGLRYSNGETNMFEALNTVGRRIYTGPGTRLDARKIVFFITDGYNTGPASDSEVIAETNRIKENFGAEVYVIGVTSEINERHLRQMASAPVDIHSYIVQSFQDLENVVSRITSSTGACLTPTPAPTPVPVPTCASAVDLVFLLDSSGSIEERQFDRMKEFVYNVLSQLEINEDQERHRIGVTTFASNVQQGFYLGEIRNKDLILETVQNLTFTRGRTQIHDAINALTTMMFTPQNDRIQNPNIAVFFTDGKASDKKLLFEAANRAKSQGIQLIVYGMGNPDYLDISNLKTMASYPYQVNLKLVERFEDLQKHEESFRDLMCNNINECSSNPCQNGGTCLDSLNMYACLCPNCDSNQSRLCYGGTNCDRMCRETSDLIVTMDASGSITKEQFYQYLSFFTEVVEELPIGSGMQMGLQTFSGTESVYFDLNSYRLKLNHLNAMMLPYFENGKTNVAGAIENIRFMLTPNKGSRQGTRKVAVIFTDGISTINIGQAFEQSILTRQFGTSFDGEEGVTIIAVGVGPDVRKENLEQLASFPTNSTVIIQRDLNNIEELTQKLVDLVCNNVNECASNPCQNGGLCVDELGGYTCKCQENHTGTHCERPCSGMVDMALAIDASGSIRAERFPIVLDYMVSIVNELEIHPDKTRVGAVKFDTDSETAFYLNSYDNKKDVQSAIRRLKFEQGRTNIASALSRVGNSILFNEERGARNRSNVQKILILFTDGKATVNSDRTIDEAVLLKSAGVHVISVAVGGDHNVAQLFAMTSDPIAQNLVSVNTIRNLIYTVNRVINNTCFDEALCLSDPCQNGAGCVDGFVARSIPDIPFRPVRQVTCTCPEGLVGVYCQQSCRYPLDVSIVVDVSGSVDSEHMLKIDFTKAMVRELMTDHPGDDWNRVGLASFSNRAEVIFHMKEFKTEMEMLQAVALDRFSGRGTNIATGLRATEQMFRISNGARDSNGTEYRKTIVIVTDGAPTMERTNTLNYAASLKETQETDIYVASIGTWRDEYVTRSLAGRGTQYDYKDYIVNVDYSKSVAGITGELTRKICRNLETL